MRKILGEVRGYGEVLILCERWSWVRSRTSCTLRSGFAWISLHTVKLHIKGCNGHVHKGTNHNLGLRYWASRAPCSLLVILGCVRY